MFPFHNPSLDQDLLHLKKKLIDYLLTPNPPTNQIIEHIFAAGGKHIRPALFFLGCQLLSYDGEHKYPIAAVCEYIHTASLLHDDVIDNSTLRRNKPTVNSVWGDETAVLSGDLIYSTACRLMVKTKSLDLIDSFAECIRLMSASELFQLDVLWKKETSYSEYEQIVLGKTAMLFEASFKAPVFLTSNDPLLVELFGNFGRNLGFAFQIADDCLDYIGDSSDVGKPVAADLFEGKITLPLIYALQEENPGLEILVNQIIESGQASEQDKRQLIDLVKSGNGLSSAVLKAAEYAENALFQLSKIKEKLNPNQEQTMAYENLESMTKFSMSRTK